MGGLVAWDRCAPVLVASGAGSGNGGFDGNGMFRGHIPAVVSSARESDTSTGLAQPRSHWSAWTSRAAWMRLGRRRGRTEHVSESPESRRIGGGLTTRVMLLDERRRVSKLHDCSSFHSPPGGERNGGWPNGESGITVTFGLEDGRRCADAAEWLLHPFFAFGETGQQATRVHRQRHHRGCLSVVDA